MGVTMQTPSECTLEIRWLEDSVSTSGKKGGKKMENEKDRQREKLQDALSLVILLENDFEAQGMDDMYCRIIHMIHENLRLAVQDQKEQ